VFAIEVDGTAIPAKKAKQVAASVAALKFAGAAPKPWQKPKGKRAPALSLVGSIATAQTPGAIDTLEQLTGHKCAAWLLDKKQKANPPADRDPAWVPALGAALVKAVGPKNDTYAAYLAGTLTTFGESGVSALVKALEAVTPRVAAAKGFIYGYGSLFCALAKLKSNAGVKYALVYLEVGPGVADVRGRVVDTHVEPSPMTSISGGRAGPARQSDLNGAAARLPARRLLSAAHLASEQG
jgi:hypothetical protein